MKVVAVMVVLACLAVLSGCLPKDEGGCPTCPGGGGGGGGVQVVLPFETVDQGVHSGVRDERGVVVRDPESWGRLWAEHGAGRVPPPPVPSADFTREMTIAFFLGEKPTSGYTVEIAEVVLAQERLVVRVAVGSPPPGGPVLQVLTQPHHIVKLPRYDLSVEFAVEERPTSPHAPPRR